MSHPFQSNRLQSAVRRTSATLLSLVLLSATPIAVLAGGNHGNEFQEGSEATSTGIVQVDAETAKRTGLKVEPVGRQRLAFGIKATGQIEALPNQKVEVTTPVKGTVTQLLVSPGDRVSAGQAVAIMSSPELAELRTTALDRRSEAVGSVQQAEADMRLAQQNLTQQRKIVTADVRQARTELGFAQERYDKDQVLLQRGAIPRRQLLESESQLAVAKSALTKAESGLPISEAQAQLQRAQSAMKVAQSRVQLSGQTYQARLRQLGANANEDGTVTLTAPIAGAVADQDTTVGESGEDAGKKVMTIVNDASVLVSGNVYEKDLAQIQTGQGVRVKPNGSDRAFNGRISVIGSVVEGETRIVPVKAELDNSGGVLKPGMFVDMEVLTDRTPVAVLAVPKSAIVETNDKKRLVFVKNGNGFQATEVEFGRDAGAFVEVKSGLFDGDQVVTQRANQLYAQSLRGGGADAHDEHEEEGEPAKAAAATGFPLPWWMVLPLGGAIAAGTFWAGTVWSSRRYRRLSTNNGYSSSSHETELYFDHSKRPDDIHATERIEEPQNPHQSN